MTVIAPNQAVNNNRKTPVLIVAFIGNTPLGSISGSQMDALFRQGGAGTLPEVQKDGRSTMRQLSMKHVVRKPALHPWARNVRALFRKRANQNGTGRIL
jgi:hypothetical protein